MKKPNEIVEILGSETRASKGDYKQIAGDEKKYEYMLDFSGIRSIDHIEKKVAIVSSKEGIPLEVTSISPALEHREASIQSLVRVWVKETQDRNELENENLEDFF